MNCSTDYSLNGEADLPCLNSNISIDSPKKDYVPLSTQHKKTAFILQQSVNKLSYQYGIDKIGFLTLTFAEHITDHQIASKRLNSLVTNVINVRYSDYVGVVERQKSGRIHYHLLVALKRDILTGADFDQFELGNYRSANSNLRSEWAYWRDTAPKYRFGRTELLPVKTSIEAVSKYVGKYIAKTLGLSRNERDKGARLVRYSRGARAGTTRFMFLSEGSKEWRRKVSIFAQIVQQDHPDRLVVTSDDLSDICGKDWAYKHRDYILSLP